MGGKKRDQRAYEKVKQHLPGLLLNIVLQVVEELGDPCPVRSGLGGMAAYSPRAMAAVCLFMEATDKTRRGMSSYLRFHQDTAGKMGLCRIPSKSTISRAYGLIPEEYLARANALITSRIGAGSRAGDSTGYSNNRYRRWLDGRTNKVKVRMGWNKLHAVIDIRTRVIIDYMVTPGNVADVTAMRIMLGRLAAGTGDFCLDAAYLAREICNQVVELNMTPYIQPKSNTVHNAKGSWSWRFMVDLYNDNPEEFYSRYHQRSIVEAVFAAIKTMYGYRLRTRKPENQKREIGMHVIGYNIGLVIRSQIKDGTLRFFCKHGWCHSMPSLAAGICRIRSVSRTNLMKFWVYARRSTPAGPTTRVCTRTARSRPICSNRQRPAKRVTAARFRTCFQPANAAHRATESR